MEKIEVITPAYMKKIREISCKESTSPSEQKSAGFLIGRPHSPLSRGRVRLIKLNSTTYIISYLASLPQFAILTIKTYSGDMYLRFSVAGACRGA
jgi:hypothetical protein